jgi:hypothetical protein
MEDEMLDLKLVEAYERHAEACPENFPVDVPREVLLHLFEIYRRYVKKEKPVTRAS